MALNPKITKDSGGMYWLEWTPDPTAEGYAFKTPGGTSRTFDPTRAKTRLGRNLVDPVTASISALDVSARVPEVAVYKHRVPVPPHPAGGFSVDSTGKLSWPATPGATNYKLCEISPAGTPYYSDLGNVLTYTPAAHAGETWQYDIEPDNATWLGRLTFSWPGTAPPPVVTAGARRLGVCLSSDQCTPTIAAWMKAQGISSVTARWEMKPDPWNSDRGPADTIAAFCRTNGFSLRIHCVLWHIEANIFNTVTTKAAKKTQLQNFATALTSAYGDIADVRIDIANECFNAGGTVRDTAVLQSYGGANTTNLYAIINDIVSAVKAVRNIPCVYNEYGYVEWSDQAKQDACVALVQNTNVDGFGCQYHPDTDSGQPTSAAIAAAVKRITDLGKQFEFTEIGIPQANPTRFTNIFNGGVDSVRDTFWGGWDANSDVSGGPSAPSQPWNNDMTPKSAIVPQAQAWAGTTPNPTPPPGSTAQIICLELGGWGGATFTECKSGGIGYYRTNSAGESLVADALSKGMKVATMCVGEGGTIGSINPSSYAAALRTKVINYQLTRVEVLNEPEGEWFWSDAGNATAMVNLLVASKQALQGTGCKILCSFQPRNNMDNNLIAAGALPYVDEVVVHPYGGSTKNTASAQGDRQMVINAHNKTGKLVAISEVGWPTAVGQPATGDSAQWTEAEQAANIDSFLAWVRANPTIVSVCSLFQYRDYGSNMFYGVTRGDGSHKPSWAVLAGYAND